MHQGLRQLGILMAFLALPLMAHNGVGGGGSGQGGRSGGSGKGGSGKGGSYARYNGRHQSSPSYVQMAKAVQELNRAMWVLRENPMDDWRQREFREAKVEVDRSTKDLAAEVARGNYEPSDLLAAKQDIAETLDLGTLAVLSGSDSSDGRGFSEDNGSFESSVSVDVAFLSTVGQGGGEARPTTTLPEGMGDRSPSTEAGGESSDVATSSSGEIASIVQAPPLTKLDELSAVTAAAAGEVVGTFRSAHPNPGTGPEGQTLKDNSVQRLGLDEKGGPLGTLAFHGKTPRAKARLEGVKKAAASLKPHRKLASFVSPTTGESLHVTGLLPGGSVVMGDFGNGVVAVQLKETDQGFQVVELSRADLVKLYLELALYWLMVLVPTGYAVYRWGSRAASGGSLRWRVWFRPSSQRAH